MSLITREPVPVITTADYGFAHGDDAIAADVFAGRDEGTQRVEGKAVFYLGSEEQKDRSADSPLGVHDFRRCSAAVHKKGTRG